MKCICSSLPTHLTPDVQLSVTPHPTNTNTTVFRFQNTPLLTIGRVTSRAPSPPPSTWPRSFLCWSSTTHLQWSSATVGSTGNYSAANCIWVQTTVIGHTEYSLKKTKFLFPGCSLPWVFLESYLSSFCFLKPRESLCLKLKKSLEIYQSSVILNVMSNRKILLQIYKQKNQKIIDPIKIWSLKTWNFNTFNNLYQLFNTPILDTLTLTL